ncbi:MAG: hypothetical protein V4793_30340, partial [Paraburkholderia tropica]
MAVLAQRLASNEIPGWEATGAADIYGRVIGAELLQRDDDQTLWRAIAEGCEQPLFVKVPSAAADTRALLASFEKEYS